MAAWMQSSHISGAEHTHLGEAVRGRTCMSDDLLSQACTVSPY